MKSNGNLNAKSNGNIRGGKTTTQPFGSQRTSTYRQSTGKPELKENIVSDPDSSISSGSRHPLYSGPKYLGASTRKLSESPRETRIPLPKTTASANASPTPQTNNQNRLSHQDKWSLDMRQPMSLKSAFSLAQKQEAIDPADDDTFSIKHAFNMASAEMNGRIDGSPSPAPRTHSRRQSYTSTSQKGITTSAKKDLGQHLHQFDRNHQLGTGNAPLRGLFGKTRIPSSSSDAGNNLVKKVSDHNLQRSASRIGSGQWPASPRKDANAVVEDRMVGTANREHHNKLVSVPSIGYESASDERASPVKKPTSLSPEKSLNWELDADFTAGDLQISNSPRIRTGRSDGGLSRRSSGDTESPVRHTPILRRSNNRLDQIRQKEIQAANAVLPEEDLTSSKRAKSRLDELRALEREAFSRRAMASSRLDEIRAKNSEARLALPETSKSPNKDDQLESSVPFDHRPSKSPVQDFSPNMKKEQIPDTPPTVLRPTVPRPTVLGSTSDYTSHQPQPCEVKIDKPKAANDKTDVSLPRNDSHDLLRRLARATSDSPPSEKNHQQVVSDNPPSKEKSEQRERSRSSFTGEERMPQNSEVKSLEIKSSRERPTVGFAGLRRDLSSDSVRNKWSSRPNSEADPTDRIEAEMKLFAPLDNYSEKGSVRGPSPISSEPAEEATPKPTKIDPLTQPTPRVTGAYVETPATTRVKQERLRPSDDKKPLDDQTKVSNATELRSRSSSDPLNEDYIKQENDDEPRATKKLSGPRSSSAPTASRRARANSRRRRPLRPVINTANPPSVKDDIRAILRLNQIDDSTLEDFDEILADQDIDDDELAQMVKDTMNKIDDDMEIPGISEQDRELQVYDRMSKSLQTGLLGIRSAKKGIERLEDKVTHTDHKVAQTPADPKASSLKPEVQSEVHVQTNSTSTTPVLITIPTLYRKSPKLRLTKVGLFTLLFLIWYIVESVFCSLYTPQYNCTPEVPCEWSPDEPYFPYAMPFMLDEWATGGKGRALTWKAGEEIGDFLAEISDWVTGTDFTQFDEKYMNIWERKRQRRRLRKHRPVAKWVAPPIYKPSFMKWGAARDTFEDDVYEMGEDDEALGADEPL